MSLSFDGDWAGRNLVKDSTLMGLSRDWLVGGDEVETDDTVVAAISAVSGPPWARPLNTW